MNKILKRLKIIVGVELICFGLVACTTKDMPKARLENKQIKEIVSSSNKDFYVENGDIITIFEDDTYKVNHKNGSVEYYSQDGEELN